MTWEGFHCTRCGMRWQVRRHAPVILGCPGCGFMGYVVRVQTPASPASDLRGLVEEMRRAVRPFPSGVRPPVQPEDVERWAKRLEDVASEVERLALREVRA